MRLFLVRLGAVLEDSVLTVYLVTQKLTKLRESPQKPLQ